jgi:hypothetical protein
VLQTDIAEIAHEYRKDWCILRVLFGEIAVW